jgi:hypothetical protein
VPTRAEGFYWVVLSQNPPEIAYWERWSLAGDAKPWQAEAVTRGKRQADFWTTNSTMVTRAIRLKA